jgi:hypothetical protein
LMGRIQAIVGKGQNHTFARLDYKPIKPSWEAKWAKAWRTRKVGLIMLVSLVMEGYK